MRQDSIQTPKNLLKLDDRQKAIAKIKVGDHLWIGEGQFPCARGIKVVSRLTPTLIVVGMGKDRWERFKRTNGYQVGGGMFSEFISAVATAEEVRAFEQQQAAAEREKKRHQREQKEREDTRQRLTALFADERIWVNRDHLENGTWTVNISGLTEAQVVSLAGTLFIEPDKSKSKGA